MRRMIGGSNSFNAALEKGVVGPDLEAGLKDIIGLRDSSLPWGFVCFLSPRSCGVHCLDHPLPSWGREDGQTFVWVWLAFSAFLPPR